MLGRWVEKMRRGHKSAPEEEGFLGQYLDAICSKYSTRYQERVCASATPTDIDALDILAELLMEEMGLGQVDLAAARAYLSILIENEHLPISGQLTASELNSLRELLFCYFNGSSDVNEKGGEVLSLIERKFSNGNFSQARILLQIFETNNETRLNNERNLYYEEMILRLDATPTNTMTLPSSILENVPNANSSDEEILRALNACEQTADIQFLLYLRNQNELNRWQEALTPLPEHIQEYLLDYVPVIRWRHIGSLEEPLRSQFGRHMTFEMLRRHVQQKLRMCYFILLASGSTGYEWFIFSFTEWSKTYFNVDVREVFPMLHRSGIVDGICLQEVLDIVTERFYGAAMNRLTIQPEVLENAYVDAIRFILYSDFSQIPPGKYNFGDFLLDYILPFNYENPMFAYRLHSMM